MRLNGKSDAVLLIGLKFQLKVPTAFQERLSGQNHAIQNPNPTLCQELGENRLKPSKKTNYLASSKQTGVVD